MPQDARGQLVYNPQASSTSPRTRDVLAAALGEEIKLDVVATAARGHAIELAAQARADGLDVVVALGGDGTVNEVANGLLAAGVPDPSAAGQPGGEVPSLAVVPGGCTNVFARTVGYPLGAVEATGQILEALRAGRRREIGVGAARADGSPARHFVFAAGLGLDAEVVARVEQARAAGKRATGPLYARTAVRYMLGGGAERRRPPLQLLLPGEEPRDVFTTLITNADPWTYLLDRPVRPTPDASYDTGLDVFALTRARALPTLRTALSMYGGHGAPRGRRVLVRHDLAALSIRSVSGEPLAFQVDGDHLGEHVKLQLRSVPRALRVVV